MRSRIAFRFTFLIALGFTPKAFSNPIKVIVALGDSVTVASQSARPGTNPFESWSTGGDGDVDSHWLRLRAAGFTDTAAYNQAKSGAKSGDLTTQVGAALLRQPDYATILIGANDVCSWPQDYAQSLVKFQQNLRSAVQRLVNSRPQIKMVLAPLPDMYRLWQVGLEDSSCQVRWDAMNRCKDLLSSTASDADRENFVARWRAANNAIEQIAKDFGKNANFPSELATADFTREHMSAFDCFHPSVKGQALIADLTWNSEFVKE